MSPPKNVCFCLGSYPQNESQPSSCIETCGTISDQSKYLYTSYCPETKKMLVWALFWTITPKNNPNLPFVVLNFLKLLSGNPMSSDDDYVIAIYDPRFLLRSYKNCISPQCSILSHGGHLGCWTGIHFSNWIPNWWFWLSLIVFGWVVLEEKIFVKDNRRPIYSVIYFKPEHCVLY